MSDPTKELGKTLTKIRSTTRLIVDDANYDTGSAGRSRNAYQQERGWQKHQRAVRRLKRFTNKAEKLARNLTSDVLDTVVLIVDATDAVVSNCDHFPGNSAWAGEEPVNRQAALINAVRSMLRGFP